MNCANVFVNSIFVYIQHKGNPKPRLIFIGLQT
jgi:hypothetical protein